MDDDNWQLTATAADLARYFPTFLANGRMHVTSTRRGTEPALTYVAGFSDHTPGDVSRPAALPSPLAIDVEMSDGWLNEEPVGHLGNYRQTLDMRQASLATQYLWTAGTHACEVETLTFVSQTRRHVAATRLILRPGSDGPLRIRLPLRTWPAPRQRLPLATLDWVSLKDTLAAGDATEEIPPTGPAPDHILTWFDLQDALAAQGRRLRFDEPTAPTRAPVWYPGETIVEEATIDGQTMIQTIRGHAAGGSDFHVEAATEISGADVSLDCRNLDDGTLLDLTIEGKAGTAIVVTRFAAISTADWPADSSESASAARASGFERLLDDHQRAWTALWRADIEVEGDTGLQRVIRSDLFYLKQVSAPDGGLAPGACGMNPNYFGHAFFDSDNWVFPVLALFHPERARQLVEFRHRTLPQAMAKAQAAGHDGATYPWEADLATGLDQTPRYAGVNAQREILHNGGIAIAQWQYYLATLDRDWLSRHGFPVIAATADYWVSRAEHDGARDRYAIRHVVSIDEKYEDVDNDAYTNAVARRNLEIAVEAARLLGLEPEPRWSEIAVGLSLPFDESAQRHLMFEGPGSQNRRTWMAGGITFLCHPAIDVTMSPQVRRNDYEHALRQIAALSPEPNQMMMVTLAVHAATLGEKEAARRWLTFRQADYLKPPFNLRSETPHNNATHHLATSTGFLEALIFGFTGLRITDHGLEGRYPPVLPDEWTGLTLRGVRCRGETFDVAVRRDGDGLAVLERRPTAA